MLILSQAFHFVLKLLLAESGVVSHHYVCHEIANLFFYYNLGGDESDER